MASDGGTTSTTTAGLLVKPLPVGERTESDAPPVEGATVSTMMVSNTGGETLPSASSNTAHTVACPCPAVRGTAVATPCVKVRLPLLGGLSATAQRTASLEVPFTL